MMGDSPRERRTRWKWNGASEAAQADPISAMYKTMREWAAAPLTGLFAESAVLLQVPGSQHVDLLNRACFGRIVSPPVTQPLPSSSYPPPVPNEGMQLFQLGLEEAFFLNYDLQCIEVYTQTTQGRIKLSHDGFWKSLRESKENFVEYYKAYSYLRTKHWVVLSGIQYGADFMAYRHHPALVHSDYAVVVMFGEERQERLGTWTDLHAMQRLCSSVAKTLLMLYVTLELKDPRVDLESPSCLKDYTIETIEVERWNPERHRETSE